MIILYSSFLEQLQNAISSTIGALIEFIMEKIVGIIVSAVQMILHDLLYVLWLYVYRVLLQGIYYAVKVLDVLSGMTDIGIIEGGKVKNGGTLLSYFLKSSSISRFFLAMTVGAAALAFIFSIYKTGRIISDSALEPEAKPISTVITNGIRCMLTFMLVPFLCVACLQLSAALLQETSIAFENAGDDTGGRTEIADVLFEMSAECALKVPKGGTEYNDYWKEYSHPYQSDKAMKKGYIYDLKNVDYFIGILSALVILLILFGACLAFVRRIIEVLVLYVVSPYFAATIPLDGGTKFAGWRESFIGAFFGCFGSIFAMRLYLIVIPLISSDRFVISGNKDVNYIAKVFFVIGSAWSIYKLQEMITGLISPKARGAGESMALASGLAFGIGGKVGRGIAGAFRGRK